MVGGLDLDLLLRSLVDWLRKRTGEREIMQSGSGRGLARRGRAATA